VTAAETWRDAYLAKSPAARRAMELRRRRALLALRQQGLSFHAIAERVGLSPTRVRELVQRAERDQALHQAAPAAPRSSLAGTATRRRP
jgi:transposase